MDPARLFTGPHRCRFCSESFSTPDKLERHVAHRHPWLRRIGWAVAASLGLVAVAALLFVWQPGPPPPPLEGFHVEDDPLLGQGDAAYKAVIIESPSCPECAWFHLDVLTPLLDGIEPDVAIWFLSGEATTPLDRAAAIAQECSNEHAGTAGFLDFSSRLYANQSHLDEHVVHTMLKEFSSNTGIPEETVMRCYYAEETGTGVDADVDVARAHDAPPGTVFLIQGHNVERMTLADFASWLMAR